MLHKVPLCSVIINAINESSEWLYIFNHGYFKNWKFFDTKIMIDLIQSTFELIN